jgi:hypothetical protein
VSDFLFATPSTIDGIASVIDLFGVYPQYNDSKTEEGADLRACYADIQALKNDADTAFSTVQARCHIEK